MVVRLFYFGGSNGLVFFGSFVFRWLVRLSWLRNFFWWLILVVSIIFVVLILDE